MVNEGQSEAVAMVGKLVVEFEARTLKMDGVDPRN